MSSAPSSLHRPFDEAPARVTLRGHAFDVVSRGDFVPGRLDTPAGDAPLVLVLHDTGSGADAAGLDFVRAWVDDGLAVARIDLPLHGRRQSPKLSERLVSGYRALARGEALDADTRALVEEFARQSVSDIVRTLEALGSVERIDGGRVALVGLGIGACACAWAAPHVSALRACVLGGGVGAFADEGLDPARRIGAAANATVYRLFTRQDDVPTDSARALAEVLPDPATPSRLGEPDHEGGLATADAKAIGAFLAAALTA